MITHLEKGQIHARQGAGRKSALGGGRPGEECHVSSRNAEEASRGPRPPCRCGRTLGALPLCRGWRHCPLHGPSADGGGSCWARDSEPLTDHPWQWMRGGGGGQAISSLRCFSEARFGDGGILSLLARCCHCPLTQDLGPHHPPQVAKFAGRPPCPPWAASHLPFPGRWHPLLSSWPLWAPPGLSSQAWLLPLALPPKEGSAWRPSPSSRAPSSALP